MAEKVDLLYRQSYHGVYGSMVVAVLWASLMWTRAPREALFTWLALMVLATAIRVALFRAALTVSRCGLAAPGRRA